MSGKNYRTPGMALLGELENAIVALKQEYDQTHAKWIETRTARALAKERVRLEKMFVVLCAIVAMYTVVFGWWPLSVIGMPIVLRGYKNSKLVADSAERDEKLALDKLCSVAKELDAAIIVYDYEHKALETWRDK